MTNNEKNYILKICKDIRKKYVKYFHSPSLKGQCYYISEKLQKELYKNKIDAKIICGSFKYYYNHTWLEYKNYIIDLTACQFNRIENCNFPLITIKHKTYLKVFTI